MSETLESTAEKEIDILKTIHTSGEENKPVVQRDKRKRPERKHGILPAGDCRVTGDKQ